MATSSEPGGLGDAVTALEQELSRLREGNKVATRENNRLRAEVADKRYEGEQLDKQIRRLERKIEALDDARTKHSAPALAKGFLKERAAEVRAPAAGPEPELERAARARERAQATGTGLVIDAATGEVLEPAALWPEQEREADQRAQTNVLLQPGGHSPEAELMREMQNTPEFNADFDTRRYTELIAAMKHKEAEDMIREEGGATLEQMQRGPLEILRGHPDLDANWCDEALNGCSLLQWASTMGFEAVVTSLLERRADPNYRTRGGISCLASACTQSWLGCARHLLAHHADPNEVVAPEGGQTLLMWDRVH